MPDQPDEYDEEIRAVCANVRRLMPPAKWARDPLPAKHEYESERLTARELGVGRFHDGRGL